MMSYEGAKLKYVEIDGAFQRRDLLLPNPIRRLIELFDLRALNSLKNLDDSEWERDTEVICTLYPAQAEKGSGATTWPRALLQEEPAPNTFCRLSES